MNENNLPKSFCVISDLHHPRWMEFIKWFNNKYNWHFDGTSSNSYYGITASGDITCYTHTSYFENIYTLDEFFKRIGKPTEEVVSHRIFVPKTDLKKIYDVACNTWKEKIIKYAEREPFDTHARLSVEEVDEMFNAATTSQKPVLESIFGVRDKSVDISNWIISTNNNGFVDLNKLPLLVVRTIGQKAYKGFSLTSEYNWEIVKDEYGIEILVPTRK